MDSNGTETAVVPKPTTKAKRLKPARKQVKPGDVVKTETVQTGKEYSAFLRPVIFIPKPTSMKRHLVQQMGWWGP